MPARAAAKSFTGKVAASMRVPFFYIALPLYALAVIPVFAVIVQNLFWPHRPTRTGETG